VRSVVGKLNSLIQVKASLRLIGFHFGRGWELSDSSIYEKLVIDMRQNRPVPTCDGRSLEAAVVGVIVVVFAVSSGSSSHRQNLVWLPRSTAGPKARKVWLHVCLPGFFLITRAIFWFARDDPAAQRQLAGLASLAGVSSIRARPGVFPQVSPRFRP